eukprot:scaffold7586_cov174-Amphora_coffeaeformis.AAC.5
MAWPARERRTTNALVAVVSWVILLLVGGGHSSLGGLQGCWAHEGGVRRNSKSSTPKKSSASPTQDDALAHVRRYLSIGPDSFRVVVEGNAEPLFTCDNTNKTCAAALQNEQDALLQLVQQQYCPSATLVRANAKLLNALTLDIPNACLLEQQYAPDNNSSTNNDHPDSTFMSAIDAFVQQLNNLPETQRAYLSSNWYPGGLRETVEYVGSLTTTLEFCLKGNGVRVAILDSGLDYTHQALSGNGTMEAYAAAYGFNRNDPLNTVRGDLFPTQRVVDGYDFIGDAVRPNDPNWDALAEDDDPIDGALGHGTGVAHALLGVAGEAQLIALKVCVVAGGCPEFAILSAMEFALDPNGDNDTSDHVDIINLSLGRPYTHPYYSAVSKAIEDAFRLGVLTVVAAGNQGNRPGIIFEAASTPNALAVGATGVAESIFEGGMADYSSRGSPSSVEIKPDLVAPGGPYDLAAAGTGSIYHKGIEGTSYSAPLVAGAAALIKQRCPECSPFAIKSILMNNARRDIKYTTVDRNKLAPISWAGAGELQVYESLTANFWAYNMVDMQPSVSLGVLNVAQDTVISKTIRVQLLDDQPSDQPLNIRASFEFRDPAHAEMMRVSFSPRSFSLERTCGDVQDVIVTIAITANKVPLNHMTTGGKAGIDPVVSLDPNEVDGWIVLTSNEKDSRGQFIDASLPLYAAVRRSSDVQIRNTLLPPINAPETIVNVGIENKGAGTAQIDIFELVHTSPDQREPVFGSGTPPADLRYVGYRTVFVGESTCEYLVEFAFNTWETVATSVNTFFEAQIDRDGDGKVDVTLSNRGPQQHMTTYTECRVQDATTFVWSCSGFAPDHAGSTSNTIVRACSNDLGLDSSTTSTLQVKFKAISFGRAFVETDKSEFFTPIMFPTPALEGPAFDVEPGAKWSNILVTGPGKTPTGQISQGLLLITNSYRSPVSTGAATRETEAIAIATQTTRIFQEQALDRLVYPKASNAGGPICSRWTGPSLSCNPFDNAAISSVLSFDEIYGQPDQPNTNNGPPLSEGEMCIESMTPRLALSTQSPTDPPITVDQSPRPTPAPTRTKEDIPDGIVGQEQFSPTPTPFQFDPNGVGGPTADLKSSGGRRNFATTTATLLLICGISFLCWRC